MKHTHPIQWLAPLALFVLAAAQVQAAESAQPFMKPDPAALERWKDMRLGMFIHWGPVSQTGYEIGWARGSKFPIEQYDNLYKTFNPVKFNADEWVGLAKAAGMKYIVLTTKHHDGFCLWNTKLTDYNIMNSPFHRDVVKELSTACKKQGIAFGTYYSVCDWHHPDFPRTSPGGKVWRKKYDLEAYNRYLLGQVRELVTNYGPLITLWNDVPQEFKGRGVNTIKMVRELQPDILVNNRTGDGGDYDTPEQRVGGFNIVRPWESCMTISAHGQWAWRGADDGAKPLALVVRMLAGCAGGDGNMLLNVGPGPSGEIDPVQAGRLKELGDWLAKYGESIYATRGGPYMPTDKLACTRKGNAIYLHVLKWDGGTLTLPALPGTIKAATLLTGGEVKFDQSADKLRLDVPKVSQQELDTIVKLELDGPASRIKPILVEKLKAPAKARKAKGK